MAGRDINHLNIYEDRNHIENILQTLKEKGYIVNYRDDLQKREKNCMYYIIQKITIKNHFRI